MGLEKALQDARELVEKFDKLKINIQGLTLYDLGYGSNGGYAATFQTILVEDEPERLNEWNALSRSAAAATATEAINLAIAKCEAELEAYTKKHYRYSNPLESEFVR